jgi:hypothetical protein
MYVSTFISSVINFSLTSLINLPLCLQNYCHVLFELFQVVPQACLLVAAEVAADVVSITAVAHVVAPEILNIVLAIGGYMTGLSLLRHTLCQRSVGGSVVPLAAVIVPSEVARTGYVWLGFVAVLVQAVVASLVTLVSGRRRPPLPVIRRSAGSAVNGR